MLYAPTYRHSKDPTAFNLLQSTIALNEALGEDARLVVRAHYLEHLDHPATDSITPLYELLASVDAVVTDFSSVAMDAVVLGIPVVFYCPDYEDYIRSPGFALDLEGVAPELCTTRARGVHDILTRFGVIERSAIASNSGFRKEYDEVARAMDSLRSLALEFESPFGGSEIVASAIMRRLLWIP